MFGNSSDMDGGMDGALQEILIRGRELPLHVSGGNTHG